MKKRRFAFLITISAIFIIVLYGIFFNKNNIKRKDKNVKTNLVAICNLDEGIINDNNTTNYANLIIQNSNLNYKITPLIEAKDGLKKGRYIAYIIIPTNFSESVSSVNLSPIKSKIKYKISKNITKKQTGNITQKINDFIETISNGIGKIYLTSILNEFHEVQNKADNIMKRDKKDADLLSDIKGTNLVATTRIPTLKSVKEFEYDLDEGELFKSAQNNSSMLKDKYEAYVNEGEENLKDKLNNYKNYYESNVKKTGEEGKNSNTYTQSFKKSETDLLKLGGVDEKGNFSSNLTNEVEHLDSSLKNITDDENLNISYAINNALTSIELTDFDDDLFYEGIRSEIEKQIVPQINKIVENRISLANQKIGESVSKGNSKIKELVLKQNTKLDDLYEKISAKEKELKKIYSDLYAEVTSEELEKIYNEASEYNVLEKVGENDKELRGYTDNIKETSRKLGADVSEQDSKYKTYIEERRRAYDDNVSELKENINNAEQNNAKTLESELLSAKNSRKFNSEQNLAELYDFTKKLEYTKLGKGENENAIDFIINPVIKLELNSDNKRKTLSKTKNITLYWIVIAVISIGIIMLFVISNLKQHKDKKIMYKDAIYT